jgi:hypothetical protein
LVPISDALKTCHVKDAAEPDVELLDVYRRSEILVRLGDDHIEEFDTNDSIVVEFTY